MGVPDLAVVLLCVLGAGAVVVAISAFGHHFLWTPDADHVQRDWNQISPEQESYMKRVRDFNLRDIYASVRAERTKQRYSGAPSTPAYFDSNYESGESSTPRMYLHSQGTRDVHSGYDSNVSRHNGQEKNSAWINERAV